MNEKNALASGYVLGHTPRETERLQQQAQKTNPATQRFFAAAGVTTGMKVLDVGCGAGDTSLLVASLVGPDGCVVGIDSNPEILLTARQRAKEAKLSNVSFVAGDLHDVALDNDFDAAVGRLILVHVAKQAQALQAIAGHLRPGGIVAFQEVDFSIHASLASHEATPVLYRQWVNWLVELFRRIGSPHHLSIALSEAFLEAGLPLPEMQLDGLVIYGPDWGGYDYLAETLRSILPVLIRLEITTAQEVDVETFAERLRTETLNQRGMIILPAIGAWTRTAR